MVSYLSFLHCLLVCLSAFDTLLFGMVFACLSCIACLLMFLLFHTALCVLLFVSLALLA